MRHIKCDRTRPVGLRCLQSGLRCPVPLERFIDEGPGLRAKPVHKVALVKRTPKTTRRHDSYEQDGDSSEASEQALARATFTQSPPSELSIAAYRDDIFLTHLNYKLFLDGKNSGEVGLEMHRPWAIPAINKIRFHPALNLAVSALAHTFFGKLHHQRQILDEGASLYGKALKQLKQALMGGDCYDPWTLAR